MDRSQLFARVADALNGKPSAQPVGVKANIGEVGENDQTKANSKAGMTVGVKMKQKGNPNRSYAVSVINKAVAKMGGH